MDYTWPSVYLRVPVLRAFRWRWRVFFFVRSWKDGYWGKEGEEIKYQVFEEKVNHGTDETED